MNKDKIQYRTLEVNLIKADSSNERSFEVTFSSETPVTRYDCAEVLSHNPSAVDLLRLQNMGVLLFNHDYDKVLGKISNVRLENDRGKATITFDDEDDEAEKIFKKVKSKTLRGISVGYIVNEYEYVQKGQKSTEGKEYTTDVYVATRWQPFEISIVSCPADPSVGIGRSISDEIIQRKIEEEKEKFRLQLHLEKLKNL